MIHRCPKDREHPFVMVARALSDDPTLSPAAKGTMLYLLARPDDWKTTAGALATGLGIKRREAARLLRELEEAGFITRRHIRSRTGWEYEVVLHDAPVPQEQRTCLGREGLVSDQRDGVIDPNSPLGLFVRQWPLGWSFSRGYVYLFIDGAGAYKIGRTSRSVATRCKNVAAQCVGGVECLWCRRVDNSNAVEMWLHRQFAEKCIGGEWFLLSDEDVAFIKGLL